MGDSKHQKTCNKGDIYCAPPADCISALPDRLLCHILSSLATKAAVSTTVLSKRWKYVWTGVPVLDFTDFPVPTLVNRFDKQQYVCYKNFVNRVLFLSSAPCLERVRLECHDGFSRSNVYEWMLTLARRCVKELFVIINLRSSIKLPETLFLDKDKLVVLKLEGYLEVSLPSSIYLPQLTTLFLTNLLFYDAPDPLNTFLSGCPILEELHVDFCQGVDEFSVCSSSLRVLRIVSIGKERGKITIKAPELQFLHLSMCIVESCTDHLSSLVEANLQISTSSVRWVKLLQRFHCLKTLTLHRIIIDGYNAVNHMPTFSNLTHLNVSFLSWPVVLQLLKYAPNLAYLTIGTMMFDWPEVMPKSKSKGLALERVECHYFDIDEGNVEMLRFFLSNSKLLKELKVHIQCWVSPRKQVRLLKTLLDLPRASTVCQISIVSREDDTVTEDEDEDTDSEDDYTSGSEDD